MLREYGCAKHGLLEKGNIHRPNQLRLEKRGTSWWRFIQSWESDVIWLVLLPKTSAKNFTVTCVFLCWGNMPLYVTHQSCTMHHFDRAAMRNDADDISVPFLVTGLKYRLRRLAFRRTYCKRMSSLKSLRTCHPEVNKERLLIFFLKSHLKARSDKIVAWGLTS